MTSKGASMRVWGVVPAAGVSRRMGFPKQTAVHRGSTMAATVVRNLLDAGVAGVVVVTRSELIDAMGLPREARVRVAVNNNPNSEMIDSVRIGLTSLGNDVSSPSAADGVLVVPADMPSLTVDIYRVCIAAYATGRERIVIATCGGRRGHPILFPFSLRSTVGKLGGGLRMLAQTHPDRVHLVETGDTGTLHDVDTPDDYQRL